MFLDYLEKNNLERLALVGTNSQGKSYMIAKDIKGDIAKKTAKLFYRFTWEGMSKKKKGEKS